MDFGFKLNLEAKDRPARKRKHRKTCYTQKPRKIKEAGANLAPESPTGGGERRILKPGRLIGSKSKLGGHETKKL